MISEGKLIVELGENVRIISNRTASVAGLLKGRDVKEVLAILPLIFSLCAHAHVTAAKLATGQGEADMALVLAENAREHLLRIMLGWRTEEVQKMPALPVMSLVDEMAKAIKAKDKLPIAKALENYLEEFVFGIDPADFLNMDCSQWLKNTNTQAAQYIKEIEASEWQNIGAVSPGILPKLPRNDLINRLQEDDYCNAPDWQGIVYETGCFARQHHHSIISANGTGLKARLLARLVELAQIPAQMLGDTILSMPAGLGIVETARGRLIHFAKIENEKIIDYKILAPTEWNFHPQGLAAQALKGLNARQAKAVIEAIDPCVDFELRVA